MPAPRRSFALRNRRHLFSPPDGHPNWHSHCQAPMVINGPNGTLSAYVCGRDASNRSEIYALSLDAQTLKVGDVPSQPVLSFGPEDAFDAHGVGVGTVIRDGDTLWMYYSGMRRGKDVPFRNGIGLARSTDGGQSFHRLGRDPVVGPGFGEALGATTPTVTKDDNGYTMLYSSFRRWLSVNGKLETVYTLRRARSDNGRNWQVEDTDAVGFEHGEGGLIRAHAFLSSDGPRLLFAERGWQDFRTGEDNSYRLKIAQPGPDGTWLRTGEVVTLDPAPKPQDWDADMQAYPWLFEHNGQRLVFFNGEDFGRHGFGVAELHEVAHDII